MYQDLNQTSDDQYGNEGYESSSDNSDRTSTVQLPVVNQRGATTAISRRHIIKAAPRRDQNNDPAMTKPGKASILSLRLTSAKRLKINELQNSIQNMQIKLKESETENRLLKRVQARQEKELSKFQSIKDGFPDVFKIHNEDVRSLQNQLRNSKDKNSTSERKLKIKDAKLQKLEKELAKLKELSTANESLDKEELKKTIADLKLDIKMKQNQILEMNKKLEILSKSHRQELNAEKSRHKETIKKLAEMDLNLKKLQNMSNEHKKQQAKLNIYSLKQRISPLTSTSSPKIKPTESFRSNNSKKQDAFLTESPGSESWKTEQTTSGRSTPASNISNKTFDTEPKDDTLTSTQEMSTKPNDVLTAKPIPSLRTDDEKKKLIEKLKATENSDQPIVLKGNFNSVNFESKLFKDQFKSEGLTDVEEIDYSSKETKPNRIFSVGRRGRYQRDELEPQKTYLQTDVLDLKERNNVAPMGQDGDRKNRLMMSLFGNSTVKVTDG